MSEDHSEDICNCGTLNDAITTAIKAVEAAYLDKSDDHMCLMFQMMVTQAIGAICLRGLHIQLNEIVRQKGVEKPEDETRETVMKAVASLQKKLGFQMIARARELDKTLTDMFLKKGNNPFAIVDELPDEDEKHVVH